MPRMTRTSRIPALLTLIALVAASLVAAPLTTHAQTAQPAQTAEAVYGPDAPALLRSGEFVNAGETGHGTALLYRMTDGTYLLRLENFRVDFGPDLRLQLVAWDGTISEVARLRGNRGNQNYTLPATFDPTLYDSTRIHCRTFNIVMIVAPLYAPLS